MTEPKVSLVMTVLNEERSLSRFLESLSAQTRRPDEVVVVDGGSTDRTVELLRAWGARVLVEPGANISRGRNLAFEVADHELVAVTDAGTVLDPAWLEGLLDASAAGTRLVAGWYEPVWHTRTERMLASIVMPLLAEVRDPDAFLPSSRSLLVTKTAWREAGGYPEWLDYCEDLVFDFALKEAGHRFAFAPQAVARWSARPTLRAYAKQYYRYARGDGKADLWRRRHALRYAAYLVWVLGLVLLPGWAKLLVPLTFLAYNARYFRRVLARRNGDLVVAVPLAVIVGDVAKMIGYPAGVWWRWRHRD